MSIKPPPGLTEEDFDSIEEAVMETARGRWFLREFARRARAADTGKLLEALTRIERLVAGQSAIAGGFEPEHHAHALDERQQRFAEIAWTLRERGYDGSICSMIENEARALARLAEGVRGGSPMFEAEQTPVRNSPVTQAIAAPLQPLPAQAEPPSNGMRAKEAQRRDAAEPTPPPALPDIDARLAALAFIDALPPREKAALFA